MKLLKLTLLLLFIVPTAFATKFSVGIANHTKDILTYTIDSDKTYDPSTTQTGDIKPFDKKPTSITFVNTDPNAKIELPVTITDKNTKQTIYSATFSLPPEEGAQPQLYDEDKSSDYLIEDASIRFYDHAQLGLSIFPKGTKRTGGFI